MRDLADLVETVDRFAADSFRYDMARALAEEARAQYVLGIRQGRSPYGPWPARLRRYSWPLMQKTRTARDKVRVRFDVGGFVLFNDDASYLRFQQYGAENLPPRELVPTEAFGLGSWREPLGRAAARQARNSIAG